MPQASRSAITVVLRLLAIVALCGCERSPAPAPTEAARPVAVQTVLPRRGEISRTVTLPTSRILALQEAVLYAKVSGYLKSLPVDKGDVVKEGQLLAEIEVPEMLADEAQYRAEADVARVNYERMARARQKAPDLVVPQTVDDLRGQWQVASAKLQRTQTLLQYARVTAPFAGVITARFVDPGAFIPAATSGTPAQSAALVTLMDLSRVRVQVFVPEAEVPFIRTGMPVRVTVEELSPDAFVGSVTRFAYALDEATKTMLVEIELPNPSWAIRPGMYARVAFDLETKSALLLPRSAVQLEKAGAFVLRLVDGRAKRSRIQTGFTDASNVEVVEGLVDGLDASEPVVVAGSQPITDGQAVTVQEPAK